MTNKAGKKRTGMKAWRIVERQSGDFLIIERQRIPLEPGEAWKLRSHATGQSTAEELIAFLEGVRARYLDLA